MLAPFRMAADSSEMRQFIRHRQGIIHAISPNNGNTRFLKGAHFARGGGIVGALYNYQENLAQPPAGSIYHSSSANNLKINVVDANGINHQSAIQNLRAGDKITIGTQSSYLTGTPGITSGVALVPVESWPNYTNGQYSVTVEKGVLPYTTVAPVISGSNLIGSTLTCTPGTWAGKPTPSLSFRQWKADGVNISGENGLTYVIAAGYAGKNITCVETATSLTGTASSSSNQIFAGITPTNITAPTVTGEGTPGEVLTCGNGTWQADPAATYTKQWRRDGSNISGQTADTYTVLAGDVGKIITCAVTATNTILGRNGDLQRHSGNSSSRQPAGQYLGAGHLWNWLCRKHPVPDLPRHMDRHPADQLHLPVATRWSKHRQHRQLLRRHCGRRRLHHHLPRHRNQC